ncbi:MAG: ribonuclease HI [Nitrospirota bacterium]
MKSDARPFVEIYTDGACSGNPGAGGYGVVLRCEGREKELSGCDPDTTNNRMELAAVIAALEALKRPCRVKVMTDSSYVVQGMTVWVRGWIRNNWKNSRKQEVLNRDLWERLVRLAGPHEIHWEWIRGHSNHAENERCDALAKASIRRCRERAATSGHPEERKT